MTADFAGRTALVTGATGGIGLEIARALAGGGARVILACRDRAKGEKVSAGIPGSMVADLDLARLDSVRAFARALDEPIHLCVLNAGIVLLGDRVRHMTVDGYERHWQTNFLGHAALVRGILPQLRAGNARVALQCSVEAALAHLNWDDLQGERRYGPFRAYGQSKVALGLFGLELARREPALHVALCHPGIAPDTAIAPALRAMLPASLVQWVTRHLGNPPAQAALPAMMAVTADAASGTFYGPGGFLQFWGAPRQLRLYRSLRDEAAARRVWALVDE
ncbi:SDR family NAD(P)-dependent oxidoreductase [Microbacterium protaetiae]|nr:SDR family NAD(P)-dependent oxidoreductase [Microbacterium protaetiae]